MGTEDEVFSLQLTHCSFFFFSFLERCLFLDGFHPQLHPTISISLFVCYALASIAVSLSPPFIDPSYSVAAERTYKSQPELHAEKKILSRRGEHVQNMQ